MIRLDSIKNLRNISRREEEVILSRMKGYLERLSTEYEFEMNNDWQIREEIKGSRSSGEEMRRYIEYLLQGGEEYKIFYINIDKARNRIDLVDGRRRIIALEEFLNNRLEVFRGSKYEDFPEEDRKELDNRVRFKIKISEIRNRRELIEYYKGINFYRGNEKQSNLIFLENLPKVEKGGKAIEIGTGREVEYWEYTGEVLKSLPIPRWIRREVEEGDIIYRDNRWEKKGSREEIKKGYYIWDGKRVSYKEEEIFRMYYLDKH